MSGVKIRRDFITVQGLKLFCVSAGKGPPLLLLHGLGASSYSWREVLPRLAETRAVLAFDWPGFGRSDKPRDFDYSPGGLSRLLVGVLDHLEVERGHLIGNSMGGLVSLWTALHHEDRVGKLALLGTPTYPGNRPKLLWPMRWPIVGSLYERCLGEWAIGFIAKSAYVDHSLITPELKLEYGIALKTPEGRRAIAEFLRNVVPPDAQDTIKRYPHMKRPTLVILGDQDCMVDRGSADRFASEVPDARVLCIPNCGHAPQEEKPEAVTRALLEFLDS